MAYFIKIPINTPTSISFPTNSIIELVGGTSNDVIFISDDGDDDTWLTMDGTSPAHVVNTVVIKQSFTKEAVLAVSEEGT